MSINVIHIKQKKIISTDTGKAPDKMLIMRGKDSQPKIGRNLPQTIKVIHEKPRANVIINKVKLTVLCLERL